MAEELVTGATEVAACATVPPKKRKKVKP